MYSKAYSDRRFAAGGDENISVPPRYGGVRFVREKRSDGREGILENSAVPMAEKAFFESAVEKIKPVEEAAESAVGEGFTPPAANAEENTAPDIAESADISPVRKTKNPLSEILKNVGEDDILIIAIILIIAAEKGENGREAILLLALLLCFR